MRNSCTFLVNNKNIFPTELLVMMLAAKCTKKCNYNTKNWLLVKYELFVYFYVCTELRSFEQDAIWFDSTLLSSKILDKECRFRHPASARYICCYNPYIFYLSFPWPFSTNMKYLWSLRTVNKIVLTKNVCNFF